jgi:hypothetical protein
MRDIYKSIREDKVYKFLEKLQYRGVEFEISSIDVNEVDSFEYLEEEMQNENLLDVEITYYSKAMEYLSKNDPSLKESLRIAEDFGYRPGDLHSELLATLLATEENKDYFYDMEDNIRHFFEELREWEQGVEEFIEKARDNGVEDDDSLEDFIATHYDEEEDAEWNAREYYSYYGND